jgi:hypothetical protein
MIESVLLLIPTFLILIVSIFVIDLYILIRKVLKLKIKYYTEKLNTTED